MTFVQNQSPQNQRLQTWPFNRRHTDGNAHSKIHDKINYNSELDLTHNESSGSVYMTDSSRTIDISEQNISPDRTSISISTGNVITTSFRKISADRENLSECPICCEAIRPNELKQMPCCLTEICSSCLLTHTITNIRNGKVKIECPSCSKELNSSTILYNSEIPVSVRERYQEILAQDLSEKQNTYIKLCPHCNSITILDENDPIITKKKPHGSAREWIRCDDCSKEWCWSCYAPSHPNETCRQFKRNHTQLDMWAKTHRSDNDQRNAQRCPKCTIYIEKIDGCDHMVCGKCNVKFCYRCGSRMRLPNYIGHDAKYSIFGCKYKLLPNRPLLRWLVRGSIFTGAILLAPVALGVIITLVAIGIPIVLVVGCFALPVYLCVQCKKQE